MRKMSLLLGATLAITLAGCSGDEAAPSTPAASETITAVTPSATEESSESSDNAEPGTEMPSLDDAKNILTFPESNPPEGLQIEVVEEGDGEVVKDTDFVLAHYEGQVWGNDVPFDSSFERGAPTGFPLRGVIAGWTQGLSGQTVGSKVILSIPSELGYAEGNVAAGIEPGDTIAFYVEIIDAFSADEGGDPNAKVEDVADLPVKITGDLGKPVTVEVQPDTPEPTELEYHVLATGQGDPIGAEGDTVYLQFTMSHWDNSAGETTYNSAGVQSVPLGRGTIFDELDGVPVGSRVLMLVPASTGDETVDAPAYAVVVDILGKTSA